MNQTITAEPPVVPPPPVATNIDTQPPGREGFTISVTLGPFLIGAVEPSWTKVADDFVAAIRAEWDRVHAPPED